jgi:fructokinase
MSSAQSLFGGDMAKQRGLLPTVRAQLRELIGGYIDLTSHDEHKDEFLVPPALGDRSGVLGAIRLAMAPRPELAT